MSNVNTFHVLAFDVGGTKIAGGLVSYSSEGFSNGVFTLRSEAPEVLDYRSVPTEAAKGGTAVLETLTNLASSFVEKTDQPILGIGVGAAGVIDPKSGRVIAANSLIPGWAGQPIKAHLEQQLGLPVAVLGDVQAHALGEVRWGVAHGAQSCLCVGIGTGLGGAFVLNGCVLRGFHGAAGHVGRSLHPRAVDMPCVSGFEGQIETIASGTGLSARFQGRPFGEELDPSRMGDYISKQAAAGNAEAIEALEFAGFALGESIATWCSILDPEIVVLSGTVTKADDVWMEAVKRGYASLALEVQQGIPLVLALLGDHAPLVGAAELLLDDLVAQGSIVRSLPEGGTACIQ